MEAASGMVSNAKAPAAKPLSQLMAAVPPRWPTTPVRPSNRFWPAAEFTRPVGSQWGKLTASTSVAARKIRYSNSFTSRSTVGESPAVGADSAVLGCLLAISVMAVADGLEQGRRRRFDLVLSKNEAKEEFSKNINEKGSLRAYFLSSGL